MIQNIEDVSELESVSYLGNISEDGNDGYVHPLTVKIFLNNIESDTNLAITQVISYNGLTVDEEE